MLEDVQVPLSVRKVVNGDIARDVQERGGGRDSFGLGGKRHVPLPERNSRATDGVAYYLWAGARVRFAGRGRIYKTLRRVWLDQHVRQCA